MSAPINGPEGYLHRWTAPRKKKKQRVMTRIASTKSLVERLVDFKISASLVLGPPGVERQSIRAHSSIALQKFVQLVHKTFHPFSPSLELDNIFLKISMAHSSMVMCASLGSCWKKLQTFPAIMDERPPQRPSATRSKHGTLQNQSLRVSSKPQDCSVDTSLRRLCLRFVMRHVLLALS